MNLDQYREDVIEQGRMLTKQWLFRQGLGKINLYHLRIVGWGVDEEASLKYQNQMRVRGEILEKELAPGIGDEIIKLGLKHTPTFTAFPRNTIEFTFEFNYNESDV